MKKKEFYKIQAEAFMRLSAVLEIVLQADMIHLNKLLEKREKKEDITDVAEGLFIRILNFTSHLKAYMRE